MSVAEYMRHTYTLENMAILDHNTILLTCKRSKILTWSVLYSVKFQIVLWSDKAKLICISDTCVAVMLTVVSSFIMYL
jgi:hypothetical protein